MNNKIRHRIGERLQSFLDSITYGQVAYKKIKTPSVSNEVIDSFFQTLSRCSIGACSGWKIWSAVPVQPHTQESLYIHKVKSRFQFCLSRREGTSASGFSGMHIGTRAIFQMLGSSWRFIFHLTICLTGLSRGLWTGNPSKQDTWDSGQCSECLCTKPFSILFFLSVCRDTHTKMEALSYKLNPE